MSHKMSAVFRTVRVELSHLRYPPVAAPTACVFPWRIPAAIIYREGLAKLMKSET